MDESDNDQMLNPKEVADILGVHQKTVHLWLRTGKIEGIKISYRAWRVPRSALTRFIEQNKNNPKKTDTDKKNKSLSSDSNSVHNSKENDTKDITHHSKMKHYIRDIMGEKPGKED